MPAGIIYSLCYIERPIKSLNILVYLRVDFVAIASLYKHEQIKIQIIQRSCKAISKFWNSTSQKCSVALIYYSVSIHILVFYIARSYPWSLVGGCKNVVCILKNSNHLIIIKRTKRMTCS